MSLEKFRTHIYRKSQIELLPHRMQVLLAYTYAQKTTLTQKHLSNQQSQALAAILNWINNPQENAQVRRVRSSDIYATAYVDRDSMYVTVYAARAANHATSNSALAVGLAATYAVRASTSWEWLYQTFLHTKGPNFPFQDTWKTDTAIALAKTIWQDRNLTLMPILADALQDAGMQDETLLKHLQKDECTLADWTLTNLLGFWT